MKPCNVFLHPDPEKWAVGIEERVENALKALALANTGRDTEISSCRCCGGRHQKRGIRGDSLTGKATALQAARLGFKSPFLHER